MRKELQKILDRWKRNELSLVDAARQLIALGFHPNDAFDLLART